MVCLGLAQCLCPATVVPGVPSLPSEFGLVLGLCLFVSIPWHYSSFHPRLFNFFPTPSVSLSSSLPLPTGKQRSSYGASGTHAVASPALSCDIHKRRWQQHFQKYSVMKVPTKYHRFSCRKGSNCHASKQSPCKVMFSHVAQMHLIRGSP